VSLGERLSLKVIAVGVENDRQLEILKSIGCRLGQGNYLGKPVLLRGFIDAYLDQDATDVTPGTIA
ncbi:MAG: EAL domain-containing protein, partial [Proteobacteria bacterium]